MFIDKCGSIRYGPLFNNFYLKLSGSWSNNGTGNLFIITSESIVKSDTIIDTSPSSCRANAVKSTSAFIDLCFVFKELSMHLSTFTGLDMTLGRVLAEEREKYASFLRFPGRGAYYHTANTRESLPAVFARKILFGGMSLHHSQIEGSL
jgi:hypothetical protein